MALGDEQIDRLTNGLDAVLARRLNQIDEIFNNRLAQFQEMLNGIKITNVSNIEMPVVKKAEQV